MSPTNGAEQRTAPEVNTVPATTSEISPTAVPDQPGNVPDRIQFPDGYSATSEFFNEIRLHVQRRLPELQRERHYTAEQLAGKEFWRLLNRGEQPLAGRCIAFMAARDLLPLTFVKHKHEYPLWYRLK